MGIAHRDVVRWIYISGAEDSHPFTTVLFQHLARRVRRRACSEDIIHNQDVSTRGSVHSKSGTYVLPSLSVI